MKLCNPIFADLSTYSPKETIPFYEHVFGWNFYEEFNYYTAFKGKKPVIGLYETPEKFKKMQMPHFWMTYIQVNEIDTIVDKARKLGGIIEMTEVIPAYGKVALIRDPQGAGFTIYEGNELKSTRTKNTPSTLVWNELHVSDINKVIPFYREIFNWEFKTIDKGRMNVLNQNKEHIADIYEISNEIKGKYEYWVSSFGVKNLKKTTKEILNNGGSIIKEEGNRILCTDNSGQAFFYIIKV